MKSHKDVVACVIDHGRIGVPMAIPIAERLSREVKRVFVFSEWEKGAPTLNEYIVGDGFKEYERASDIWDIKNEVDLFVFPDVQLSGLQLELESQGKAVWGARKGDFLELDRSKFLSTLKEIELEVPPFQVIQVLNALRGHLRGLKDQYIKVSLFRGSFETSHFRSWKLDESLLDTWACRFGPCKEMIKFLVFPNIDTPLEIGADTYSVDGQWPSKMLHGVEWKDKAYLGVLTERDSMPQQIRQVLTKISPILKENRYRQSWSMEVRVKGKHSYFIDATCRSGLPSTGSQLELWKNFAEILWHGAHGELVEPKPTAKYTAEAMIHTSADPCEWRVVEIPEKLKQWVKLSCCCNIDGLTVFPAHEGPSLSDEVGWLVAVGDTPEQTIKLLNSHADALPDGLNADTEQLSYVLKEIQMMEKSGIKFGDTKMPPPSFVMAT